MATGKLLSVKQGKSYLDNEDIDYANYKVFGFDSTKDDKTYVREWNQPNSLIYNSVKEEEIKEESEIKVCKEIKG